MEITPFLGGFRAVIVDLILKVFKLKACAFGVPTVLGGRFAGEILIPFLAPRLTLSPSCWGCTHTFGKDFLKCVP